jgi:hypothetical protein
MIAMSKHFTIIALAYCTYLGLSEILIPYLLMTLRRKISITCDLGYRTKIILLNDEGSIVPEKRK